MLKLFPREKVFTSLYQKLSFLVYFGFFLLSLVILMGFEVYLFYNCCITVDILKLTTPPDFLVH